MKREELRVEDVFGGVCAGSKLRVLLVPELCRCFADAARTERKAAVLRPAVENAADEILPPRIANVGCADEVVASDEIAQTRSLWIAVILHDQDIGRGEAGVEF